MKRIFAGFGKNSFESCYSKSKDQYSNSCKNGENCIQSALQ